VSPSRRVLRPGGLLLLGGVEGILVGYSALLVRKMTVTSLGRMYTSNEAPCQCVGGERSMVLERLGDLEGWEVSLWR
jgi:hypothetical protein